MVLLVVAWLGVWSNHFYSGFHFDDAPVILANSSVAGVSDIPTLFVHPRLSSLEKDSAVYHPLLSAWFAIDNSLAGGANPFLYQFENFVWFIAVLVVLFLLLRLIPGVGNIGAGFATLLFGLHPVVADTVNYALQRGVLMGSFGVVAGLLVWVVWPWRLPQKLPLKLQRVPQHGFDEYLRKNFQRLEARYLKIIHAPLGLYFFPVIPALLSYAAAAVFAPILAVYVVLFDRKRGLRQTIPAMAVCLTYWILQFFWTRDLREFTQIPAANYLFTQPWVALRCLFRFFVPVNLSADSDLPAFRSFLEPLAIAGYLGVAALIFLAIRLGRVRGWRAVSFGIWWFLLAQLPEAIVPHHAMESSWRMFLPFIGLSIVVARLVSRVLESLPRGEADEFGETRPRFRESVIVSTAGAAVVLALAWATYARTNEWRSESALWRAAVEVSPRNARAVMRYGISLVTDRNPAPASEYLNRAVRLAPHDAVVEVNAASLGFARLSRAREAEEQFRGALKDAPSWAPAYSSFANWLLNESRQKEATELASKAIALDPYDAVARHVVMEIYAQQNYWTQLRQFANETLRLLPENPDAKRSLQVADTGLQQLARVEKTAEEQPSVDTLLNLSVQYYNQRRYDDCLKAAREALKINPNLAEAWANIAAVYHTQGNLDETIKALQEEVRLNPDLPSAKSNLEIELAVKRGREKNAPAK